MILGASSALLVLQILSEEASSWLCNFVTILLDNGGIRYGLMIFCGGLSSAGGKYLNLQHTC